MPANMFWGEVGFPKILLGGRLPTCLGAEVVTKRTFSGRLEMLKSVCI